MIRFEIEYTFIRKLFPTLLIFMTVVSCNSQTTSYSERPISHDMWNTLLEKYVSEDGHVNYRAFKKDTALFNRYLDLLGNNAPHPEKWTKNEKMAYWINAYNAFTIKLILDHYPLNSIKDITALNIPKVNSPWTIDFINIGDKTLNLDEIENEILRKEFDDPRIHFAINCASVSCPKLLNESYNAKNLDEQLDNQTRYFLNDSGKNKLSKDKTYLSKIFSWYKKDFTENGTLIDFINDYSEVKIKAKAEIEYLDYNWNLNE